MADDTYYVIARLNEPGKVRAEWGPFNRAQAAQVKGIMNQAQRFVQIEIVPDDYHKDAKYADVMRYPHVSTP